MLHHCAHVPIADLAIFKNLTLQPPDLCSVDIDVLIGDDHSDEIKSLCSLLCGVVYGQQTKNPSTSKVYHGIPLCVLKGTELL